MYTYSQHNISTIAGNNFCLHNPVLNVTAINKQNMTFLLHSPVILLHKDKRVHAIGDMGKTPETGCQMGTRGPDAARPNLKVLPLVTFKIYIETYMEIVFIWPLGICLWTFCGPSGSVT